MLHHRNLKAIHLIMEQQDRDGIMWAAHACKGSRRSIGATFLAEVSMELEEIGRDSKLEGVTESWSGGSSNTIELVSRMSKNAMYSLIYLSVSNLNLIDNG